MELGNKLQKTEYLSMAQMESSRAAKRLWRIVRVVFYMLRKGISKDKLMMDLQLLLKRGKTAGKALGNFMTFHHHHHHHGAAAPATTYSSFSGRSRDPDLSFYAPKDVEFSCSNTPAYASLRTTNRSSRHRGYDYYDCDAAAIATAFEMLNSEMSDVESVMASPSPAPISWSFGKSPSVVRQLRITDSPFPLREEEDVDNHIDEQAEEFINRFYEQLRLQQRIPMTPEYKRYRRAPLMHGTSLR